MTRRLRSGSVKCRKARRHSTLSDFRIASAILNQHRRRTTQSSIYQRYLSIDWVAWLGPFTIPVDPYFPELVWESYASYRARQHCLRHKGNFATWPCLTSVWVHGLEVPVTLEAIKSFYWVELIPSHPIFLRMKMDSKAQQFQWVAYIIAHGHPQWALFGGLIHRRDLKYKARI
ncbi:hypothetical protein HAX54_040066 [Datura stramonium]|uniref:Uncharacterized protein n=1 Tax=Datura stramonium TaxID=4076 RepID=A0ABS8VM48_DATST|nr:hypothetical protein [Datura stramonium]